MIRFSLKTAQEQARYIGRLLESDKDEVKRCQNIVLRPYREQARTLMDALAERMLKELLSTGNMKDVK